jgi:tRNA pseudouridine13 synthase
MSTIREREDDEAQDRSAKRSRLEDELTSAEPVSELTSATSVAVPTSSAVLEPTANSDEDEQILPKSHALLSAPSHAGSGSGDNLRIRETDVGISEYVGHDIPKIEGIIKQRYAKYVLCISTLMTSAGSQTSWCTRWTWMATSCI